jgi:hypothetical protein
MRMRATNIGGRESARLSVSSDLTSNALAVDWRSDTAKERYVGFGENDLGRYGAARHFPVSPCFVHNGDSVALRGMTRVIAVVRGLSARLKQSKK